MRDKDMKIKTKVMIIVVIAMLSATLLFVGDVMFSYTAQMKEHLKEIKKDAYATKEKELTNYAEMANKVLNSYWQRTKKDKILGAVKSHIDEQSDYLFTIIEGEYKKYHNKMSDKRLKKLIISIVKNARYGKSGYFWINDFNYKMIMHPIKEEYTGKYFKSNAKVPFVALGVDKLKSTQKERGYIQYSFYSPHSRRYEEKTSVVRVFKPYNWIIGTGAYVDDLTAQMQKEALVAIKNMRYGKNGYFWVNNMENRMLMHPIKPEYDNKFFINTPKVPFVQLGTEKLKRIKKDKAFIDYSFYTPATQKYSHKLSIVQRFKPWDWVIGTGVYTDDIDKKIALEKELAKKKMIEEITNILLISFLLFLVLIFIIVKFMEKIIIKPLNDFQSDLNRFFNFIEDETVEVALLTNDSNDEIGIMSQNTNKAIESAVKTHKELIDLRKQLEEKVETTTQTLDKTQKEFDIVNQTSKESLQYGATIQTSILPDKKTIDSVFSNHFIFDAHKDVINSQFYIFEEIRVNEYLYLVIDSKETGIKSVFDTMLINATIKQAINQLKYEKDEEISSAWFLEYLNTKIENTQNGFDGAIVYYNKNENLVKYSSANLPFHYFQDDSFHIIKPDTQSIGVDKDVKYAEHIIDVKEYMEFYIATHHYIKEHIDIYDFISPFQTDTNQFKEYLNKVDGDIIVSGFQIDNKPKVLIEYEGRFTQKSVNHYMEMIEDKIENMGLMSNISTNFVEQYQNILNYVKAKEIAITDVTPVGSILLQKNPDNSYSIRTTNIVTLADKQKIEPKLFEINSLDKNGIRKRYRELRKSGVNTHTKGGGIGFYEIAKRCSKIEYSFTQINEDRFEFEFISFS